MSLDAPESGRSEDHREGREGGGVHAGGSRRLELLAESAARLLAAARSPGAVGELCRRVMALAGCDVYVSYVLDERRQRLRLAGHDGVDEAAARSIRTLELGQGVVGRVAALGRPEVMEGVQERSDDEAPLPRSVGLRAFVCHPLLAGGRVLGALAFGSRTRAAFDVEDLRLTAAFADEVAAAVDGRRRLASLEREVRARTAELERTTASLEQANARLREEADLYKAGRMVVFRWGASPGWPVETVSSNVKAVLGWSPEDFTSGRVTYPDLVHPADVERVMAEVGGHLEAGVPSFEQSYRIRHADGRFRWVYDFTIVRRDAAGDLTHLHGYVLDVTERVATERELRRSEAALRLAGSMAHLGTWETRFEVDPLDPDAYPPWWSPEVFRIFGYEPGSLEVSNELFFSHVHPDDLPVIARAMAAALAEHRPYEAEVRIVRTDGVERVVWLQAEVAIGESGGLRKLTGAIQDITERKETERALRDSEEQLQRRVRERTAELEQAHSRLRSMSRRLVEVEEKERRAIARELHDEAGQALTALVLGLSEVEREARAGRQPFERLEALRSMTEQVMQDLHELAVRLRPASLDRLGLQPALRQLTHAAGHDLQVELELIGLDDGPLPFEVETTLYRVVQEALTNVVRHAGAHRASVRVERRPAHVLARIEDDGRGFTVKPALAGGRLGLLGMRERVELVGGTLEIDSRPGHGTTVRLELPLGD